MILQHLSLTNFRAFSRLDVDVPGGIVLLHGENAQGKTSLLEAVYFLATFTSFLTSQDSQVIHFLAREETIPVARIVADITDQGRHLSGGNPDYPPTPGRDWFDLSPEKRDPGGWNQEICQPGNRIIPGGGVYSADDPVGRKRSG